MEFPIKFRSVKSGWPIVYIEGSQVIQAAQEYVGQKKQSKVSFKHENGSP